MPNSIQFIPSGRKRIAKLLDAATTIQTSAQAALEGNNSSYQMSVSGTGAVSASVDIEYSNDGVGWLLGATISKSGTDSASDGFVALDAPWVDVRAKLTAISGTGAAVTLTVAMED